tara:strand:+ start:1206 stop:2735 length:1530 start_codon:yes stop_codon:yes gene_type:complete
MKGYQKQLLRTIGDPVEFISRLFIIGKDGKKVKLIPNQEQVEMLEALLENIDTLVLKGRQIGSSTIVSAYLFWRWYTSQEPSTTAILSHKLNSSKHLLGIYRTFYDNLPSFLQRKLSVDNTTTMKLKDSGASIIAVSAEGKGGLRSFTCSYLHISEYAFAPNPEELKATALSALNDGQLIIETTANHFNDAMHQEIMRHEQGSAHWKYLFFPWFKHKGYSSEIPEEETFEPSDYERSIKEKYDLTDEQLYWRRTKEQKLGSKEKFRREFPSCIEDAYAISGNTYLTQEDFGDIEILKIEPNGYSVFDDPDKNDSYAIGVDVSAGVKRDYSVIFVISKRTYQPVLIWRSNETSPVVLAERVVDIANQYNNSYVLVESNNFGNVVLNEMNHLGFYNIYKTSDNKDWITTRKSKTQMFENLKETIQRGYIQILDNITYSELRAITVSDKGDIELKSIGGSHSDNAVAIALAYMALEKVRLKEVAYLPQWIKYKNARKTIQSGGVSIAAKRRY